MLILGVATIGVLAVVWFVARLGNELWLIWPLASLMFVVVFMGAWFAEGHPANQAAAATSRTPRVS